MPEFVTVDNRVNFLFSDRVIIRYVLDGDTMNAEKLVMIAEVFSAHTGLKLSTISTYARNDGKFFGSLKSGSAGCTLKTAESVIRWFDENWPSDLEWPDTLPRPSTSNEAAA